jgi:hypothetical protein
VGEPALHGWPSQLVSAQSTNPSQSLSTLSLQVSSAGVSLGLQTGRTQESGEPEQVPAAPFEAVQAWSSQEGSNPQSVAQAPTPVKVTDTVPEFSAPSTAVMLAVPAQLELVAALHVLSVKSPEVASSWRVTNVPRVVAMLRGAFAPPSTWMTTVLEPSARTVVSEAVTTSVVGGGVPLDPPHAASTTASAAET